MNSWLWILPCTSSVCGLIIATITFRIIMRRFPAMMKAMISSMNQPIQSMNERAFDNIQPLVESHIDNFLRHKLSKAMPMLSMFIGEKTINQLKSVFMKELEDIFPEVIGSYSGDLLSSAETRLTPVLASKIKTQLNILPIAGFIAGLLTGVIQLLVIIAFK